MQHGDVHEGDVLNYHAVIGRPPSVPVRVESEPWQLASGEWICKARSLVTGAVVRPAVRALECRK